MVRPLGMTEDEYQAFIDESIAKATGGSVTGGGYFYSIKDTSGDVFRYEGTGHMCFGRITMDVVDEDGIMVNHYYTVGGEDYSTAALSKLQSRAV